MSARTLLVAVAIAAPLLSPLRAPAGEVRGVVRFTAAPPPAVTRVVTRDAPTCGASTPDETVAVKDGALANVVVRVNAPKAPAPTRVRLDQQRCRYVPHVSVAPVGSTLEIANGDPILHGVIGHEGKAVVFDVPMPPAAPNVPRTLKTPGVIRVGCNVHEWMSAWIVVVDEPAAVSDAAGKFSIPDVPAGDWIAVAWHEKYGEKIVPVKVGADGAATVEVAYP